MFSPNYSYAHGVQCLMSRCVASKVFGPGSMEIDLTVCSNKSCDFRKFSVPACQARGRSRKWSFALAASEPWDPYRNNKRRYLLRLGWVGFLCRLSLLNPRIRTLPIACSILPVWPPLNSTLECLQASYPHFLSPYLFFFSMPLTLVASLLLARCPLPFVAACQRRMQVSFPHRSDYPCPVPLALLTH